ncbi:hypothetical protein H8D85_01300 [bacterium]|nr:hypothetical protein [bacterium]
MKTIIEITLPVIPYEQDISDLAGYLQQVVSEMTNSHATVAINDFNYTDKVSIFKSMRKKSIYN